MHTVWYCHKPPSIGWWTASVRYNKDTYCWWDGEQWSLAVSSRLDSWQAGQWAKIPNPLSFLVSWRDRPNNWPSESYT